MATYKQLEPDSLSAISNMDISYNGTDVSFLATSSFLFVLLFSVIIAAAFYEYVLAGIHRMRASEPGVRESNAIFKRTTLGLLGVFGLFVILASINSSMLSGDISLSDLQLRPVGGSSSVITQQPTVTGTVSTAGSGGNTRTCESKESIITKMQSPGGVCAGTTCTVLSGCNYQQYNSYIDQAVGGDTKLKKMIIVTMCKESRGKVDANNRNENGTYDCGLMQVNQAGPCDASILDPATNIARGVAAMKEKINNTRQTYPNIPEETGPFSSYNCCANGTIPNAPSNDCTQAAGFPFTLPKWACPINPGDGAFNMCSVKSYVCELSVCMNQL